MKKQFNAINPKNKLPGRFNIFIWTLFDFANTSYSIVVVTFIFAVYFKDVIASKEPIGDLYWGIGVNVSMILAAIISPILGAIADHSAGKKRFLMVFTIICIIATSMLYFLEAGDIFWAMMLFIIANIGFEAGLVFYDAFLPELTTPKNYGRVSGYGFGMGYIGSLVVLAILFPFIQKEMIKETFPLAAAFFLIFATPLFFILKDNRRKALVKTSFIKIGFNRVKFTITHLKNYKNLSIFLIAFFFYIEGVNTVIVFSGIYARTTLSFSIQELMIFFIIVQTTAILGSVIFGIISDSVGQKRTIVISLVIWIFTILLAYFTSSDETIIVQYLSSVFDIEKSQFLIDSFYFVGLLAGSVMGATQSVSRSLMSKLTPDDKKTEFFGFYSFFGKSSAAIGPLVFGYVSYATGSQRIAILTICFFFLVGLALLKFVKDPSSKPVGTV